eukprot:786707-Rhodomonas_salina.1
MPLRDALLSLATRCHTVRSYPLRNARYPPPLPAPGRLVLTYPAICTLVRDFVSELRRRFGRYALFWADELKGDCVAVLWKPAEV